MAKTTPITGSMARDGNDRPIYFANQIQTSDASATPLTSPLTVGATILTLTVPTNAVSVTFYSTAGAVRISELPGVTTYFVLAASSQLTISCAKQSAFYLVEDSTSATLQFFFSFL
jgi:hypothetical protein